MINEIINKIKEHYFEYNLSPFYGSFFTLNDLSQLPIGKITPFYHENITIYFISGGVCYGIGTATKFEEL